MFAPRCAPRRRRSGAAALGTVRPPHPNPAPTAPSASGCCLGCRSPRLIRGAVPMTTCAPISSRPRWRWPWRWRRIRRCSVMHADRGSRFSTPRLSSHGSPASTTWSAQSAARRCVGTTRQQESFWATMKVEFYDRYLWPTKAAAKLAVGDWIERVYNRRRRHSALAMISPVDFEDRLTQTAQAA